MRKIISILFGISDEGCTKLSQIVASFGQVYANTPFPMPPSPNSDFSNYSPQIPPTPPQTPPNTPFHSQNPPPTTPKPQTPNHPQPPNPTTPNPPPNPSPNTGRFLLGGRVGVWVGGELEGSDWEQQTRPTQRRHSPPHFPQTQIQNPLPLHVLQISGGSCVQDFS